DLGLHQPAFRDGEQGGEDGRIVLPLQKAEQAEVGALPLLDQPIHLRADAAHGLPVAARNEQGGFAMLEPGIALGIEMLKPLEPERRHPIGIVAIDREGYVHETPEAGGVGDALDPDVAHGTARADATAAVNLAPPVPAAPYRRANGRVCPAARRS